ncbi:hypothetical protein TGME49_228480 [Toxoplasma gondii ME49]|uniref:Uncharacterized protein n=1 Tax=Toxoplasma gondii (strain ATCC 50611 / Me49) TaxID=508771 RepID=S8GFY9_TOXGM|nr:hypothetical protein TGME49_228480 [Toxoplasma gondii ME49]EPT27334.1 hypothetical protein TGME49_228480 [Toxoplasma gondii ME49]|eukprot:XP_002366470.1 hypothetical protein TGME49_228480 [Toxoplasma gondii ME49]
MRCLIQTDCNEPHGSSLRRHGEKNVRRAFRHRKEGCLDCPRDFRSFQTLFPEAPSDLPTIERPSPLSYCQKARLSTRDSGERTVSPAFLRLKLPSSLICPQVVCCLPDDPKKSGVSGAGQLALGGVPMKGRRRLCRSHFAAFLTCFSQDGKSL